MPVDAGNYEFQYRDVSGKKCLACQRSLMRIEGVKVQSRATDGWEEVSSSLTLHRNCVGAELLTWLRENEMICHGDLVVTCTFSKLENIFQQPKLQAMVKAAMDRSRRSQSLYDEDSDPAFYRSKRWKRIADTIRRDHAYRCFRCKRKERKELPVHHLDWIREHNMYENLVPVCDSCHRHFHERITLEELPKYMTKTLAAKRKETKDERLRAVYVRLYDYWSRQRVPGDDRMTEKQYGWLRDLLHKKDPEKFCPAFIVNCVSIALAAASEASLPPSVVQEVSALAGDSRKVEYEKMRLYVPVRVAGKMIDGLLGKATSVPTAPPVVSPVQSGISTAEPCTAQQGETRSSSDEKGTQTGL